MEADVPEHWKCPIAVTSWITQCVMAGKLFELHNPDVPILGLDPLAVRVLERRKGRVRYRKRAIADSSQFRRNSSSLWQEPVALPQMQACFKDSPLRLPAWESQWLRRMLRSARSPTAKELCTRK